MGNGNNIKNVNKGKIKNKKTFNLKWIVKLCKIKPIKKLIDKTINSTMPNPLKISRFTLMFLGIKYIIFYQHPIYY